MLTGMGVHYRSAGKSKWKSRLRALHNRYLVLKSEAQFNSGTGEIPMRILRIGFVFGGFLSLILSLSTQTARAQSKPAPHPAGQSSAAAQAKPKYKAIWEPVNYTEDISLNSVYFVSAQTGWVSGGTGSGAGVILYTEDGGDHWSVQWGDPQGKDDAPTKFFFLDATHGWVRQGYNDLLHTTDGKTWVAGAKIDHYNADYVFTSEKNGIAISGGRGINHTTDGGRTWNEVNQCSAKIQVDGLPRNVECNWDKLQFSNRDHRVRRLLDRPPRHRSRGQDHRRRRHLGADT